MSRTFLTACVIVLLCGGTPARASDPPPPEVVRAAAKRFAVELEQRTEMARIDGERGLLDHDRLRRDVEGYRSDLEWLTGQAAQLDDCDRDELRPTLDAVHALVWNLGRAAEGQRLPERSEDSAVARSVPVSSRDGTGTSSGPANDACTQATVATLGVYSGTSAGASNDGAASCGSSFFSPDVWFSFTPETAGYHLFETFDASFDTVLSIHEGCPASIANELACNDDFGDTSSFVRSVWLAAETTYLIRVSGFDGASGAYNVLISEEGGGISGTVTESDGGAPVTDGEVRLFDAQGMYVGSADIAGDGSYLLSRRHSGTHFVTAPVDLYRSPWIAELWQDAPCPGGSCDPTTGDPVVIHPDTITSGVDFAVQRAGMISVSVVDDLTGEPVDDALVSVYNEAGSNVASEHSDAAGQLQLRGFGAGAYYLRTSHEWYAPEVYDGVPCPGGVVTSCDPLAGTPIALVADQAREVEVRLQPKASISGHITSSADGLPLYGAVAWVYTDAGTVVTTAHSDATGAWRAGGLEPGVYYLAFTDYYHNNQLYDGIECTPSCSPVTAGTPIAVDESQSVGGIDATLTPRGRIVGTVTDETTGDPVLDHVYVYFYDRRDGSSEGRVTASEGHYESYGELAGEYLIRTESLAYRDELYDDLPCEHACDTAAGTPVTVIPGADTTADFVLLSAGRMAGSVTLEGTGEPVSAKVEVWSETGKKVKQISTSSGAWSLTGLSPGTYYVSTRDIDEPYAIALNELFDDIPCWRGAPESCAPTTGTAVQVQDGTTPIVDFVLPLGGTLSGSTTDALTGEVISASIKVRSTTGPFTRSSSTADGHYTARGLAPDSYQVLALSGSHADSAYPGQPCNGEFPIGCDLTLGLPVALGYQDDVTDIDIPLPPLSTLSGSVSIASDGSPCSTCRVKLWTAEVQLDDVATSPPSNEFTIGGVWPGTHYLSARNTSWSSSAADQIYEGVNCSGMVSPDSPPGCRPIDGTPIQVSFGQQLTGFDFSLAERGGITGTVRYQETGTPVSDREIEVWSSPPESALVLRTDVDEAGRYEARHLAPGTYYVSTARGFGDYRLLDILYRGFPCYSGPTAGGCTASKGTPVIVQADATTEGIDFDLPAIVDPPSMIPGIAGIVVDDATDELLANIVIDAWDAGTGQYVDSTVSTSTGGWFVEVDPGTYRVSTANGLGYTDQLWSGIDCPEGSAWSGGCDPTLGLEVEVDPGAVTGGLFFRLTGPTLFKDGFESGAPDRWSAVAP